MAGAWRTVMEYKKIAIMRNIELGKKYNIEEVTNLKFEDPKFFFTIQHVSCLSGITYHVDVKYILEYPYVTFYNVSSQYKISAFLWVIVYDKGGRYYAD